MSTGNIAGGLTGGRLMGLSAVRVEKLTKPGRYLDEHGLYLQVMSETNRSWLLRYALNGRERWMGLGPLSAFGLAQARVRALKARQLLADGIDPIETRRQERTERLRAAANVMTFREAAEAFFDAHESKWSNPKHRNQFVSTMEAYVYPHIGALAVSQVDTAQVLRVLEPIWGTKTETASRVRRRIEWVLSWAAVRGYRTGENPAQWRGRLQNVLPQASSLVETKHHAALPFGDMGDFWTDLGQKEGVAARALQFIILTAARTGEVIGARWTEFDLDSNVWAIPANRMKAKREHRVPLSPQARAILDALPREGEFVFPGGRKGVGLSNMAMANVLKRMGRGDLTVHGFRSTFRDWAAERTTYANHVVEMALAHSIGDRVEAAYRRGELLEKRQRLMAEWARYCGSPIVKSADNVRKIGATA